MLKGLLTRSWRLKLGLATAGLVSACAFLGAPTASAIVGGAPATGDFPWIASIHFDGFLCTGQLVTPTEVLTAAHCATQDGGTTKTPLPVKDYSRVTLGANDFFAANVDNYKVTKVTVDPEYDPASATGDVGDLALLTLDRRASEQPLRVIYDQESGLVKAGTEATILGYGATVSGGSGTRILQEAQVPIQATSVCAKGAEGDPIDPSIDLCAGPQSGGVGSCHGDSGGPLVVPDYAGQFVLVGVVAFSGGLACATKGDYSYYSRLQGVAQGAWLDGQIGSHAGPVASPSVQPDHPAIVLDKAGALVFRFTNPTGSVLKGTATLSSKSGRLGRANLTLQANGATVVSIPLSRAALRQLTRKHSLVAQLTARISASKGQTFNLHQTVTIEPRTT